MSRGLERLDRLVNALPTGFSAHPCDVEGDAAELTALTNENARVVGNPLMYSEGDTREELTLSGVDVRSDVIVVRKSTGAITAWAWVMPDTEAEKPRVYLFGGVRPGFQGIGLGRHLFTWSQDRASELLAPFPGATIQAHCFEGDQRAQRLYVAAGMRPIRYYSDMLLRFADRPTSTNLADAPIPDDYRSVAIADLDLDELRKLRNHCFADHWGTSSMSDADWRGYLAAESMRLGMSEAIADAHGRLVASQLTSEFPQDAEMIGRVLWLGNLGVHREHRNRGLARLLLERHLIRSARDGYEGSMLDVDAESLTGAHHLYKSMGYRKSSGAVRYILGDAEFS